MENEGTSRFSPRLFSLNSVQLKNIKVSYSLKIDKHGLEKRGLDKNGHDKQDLVIYHCDKHDLDKNGLH